MFLEGEKKKTLVPTLLFNRLAYGPTVYFVTRYIGRLRAAIAASKTITAEHAKLFEKASGDLAREVKRIMAFLFVINVKKSPFFVDAEEDTYVE